MIIEPWAHDFWAILSTPVVLEGGTLTCSKEVWIDPISITGWGAIAADVLLFGTTITGIDGVIRITGSIEGRGTLTNVVNP